MKAKNEELLYQLCWTCDQLSRPTFRNLTDSFEQWAYRNGLSRQLAQLRKQKLIEQKQVKNATGRVPVLNRAYRLTDQGRMQALGGRDPESLWNRKWDGRWSLVVFDIPNADSKMRARLRQCLRRHGFGCLQQSVWIGPHPVDEEEKLLSNAQVDVKSLILMEARPCAGETDAEIVAGAWDFDVINRAYSEYRKTLKLRPKHGLRTEVHARDMQIWARRECEAWRKASVIDPYLPKELLPSGYLGRIAWEERVSEMEAAGNKMREFEPPK